MDAYAGRAALWLRTYDKYIAAMVGKSGGETVMWPALRAGYVTC